jgi:preprotein translocase SecE subunit
MESIKKFFVRFGRGTSRFFVGVVKELRRVRWPKGKVLAGYMSTVIFFIVFWGLYLYLINYVVVALLKSVGN